MNDSIPFSLLPFFLAFFFLPALTLNCGFYFVNFSTAAACRPHSQGPRVTFSLSPRSGVSPAPLQRLAG